ncbi:MAG: heparinase [Saprospiraceae bacterium]|nr:heparinase [Saprospiraceae bacterium]
MKKLILLCFSVATLVGCNKSSLDKPAEEHTLVEHPTILMHADEEAIISDLIEKDATWYSLHASILKECNRILGKEVLKRKMVGRRLLATSRELLSRVFQLSYGFRMTGDERFSLKAIEEMLAAAAFTDWNPSHFLDVAEMTMGMAIGYDWLYKELSEEDRKVISGSIAHKGLRPSYDSDYNWFLRSSNNWNQVCNAGMVLGALAIQNVEPELAKATIERAIETVGLAMEEYKPDGAYPEGYGYWGYGTSFNVVLISALEKAGYDEINPSSVPGYLETGEFMKHMIAPSGLCYNWGDCSLRGSLSPAMFWFAERNGDPSVLWSEKKFLTQQNFRRNRLMPAALIWGKEVPLSAISEPGSKMWVAQGKNPVALMRTSWSDPNAIFLGFKAGSPSVNHGHMDIGSFIMEADGVRWAIDLGLQGYESLESKGIKVFGKGQDAQRWSIFRLNNYAHSTLTINDALQRVAGYAKIDRHGSDPNFMFAISDISTVYHGQAKKATRGVAIRNDNHVVIQDEIEAGADPTKIRWNLVTSATVELAEKMITLTKDGKKLFIQIDGPDDMVTSTWSTVPTTDYDADNPNTIMVGFEYQMKPNEQSTFEVRLLPQDALGEAALQKALAKW